MAAIRQVESGGNYKAVGPPTPYGRATGAYQFLDSTWGGHAGFRRAADAPPSVQDARAAELMGQYFAQFGSWRAVAIAWHAGPGVARRYVRGQDIGNIGDVNITTKTYADRVMAGFGRDDTGSGSSLGNVSAPGIDALSGALGDLSFWKRIGMGLLGVALIVMGAIFLAKDSLIEGAKVAANVI